MKGPIIAERLLFGIFERGRAVLLHLGKRNIQITQSHDFNRQPAQTLTHSRKLRRVSRAVKQAQLRRLVVICFFFHIFHAFSLLLPLVRKL